MVARFVTLSLLVCGCCPEDAPRTDLPGIDVEAIAVSMASVEPPPAPEAKPEYRVVMYSAVWCAPCQRWKSNEKPKVVGTLVIKEYKRGAPEGIRVYPTFVIEKVEGDKVTEVKRFEGYTSAAKLNAEIK
jgi:hypothetical protein